MCAEGHHAEAIVQYERSAALGEKASGADSAPVSFARINVGKVLTESVRS